AADSGRTRAGSAADRLDFGVAHSVGSARVARLGRVTRSGCPGFPRDHSDRSKSRVLGPSALTMATRPEVLGSPYLAGKLDLGGGGASDWLKPGGWYSGDSTETTFAGAG